MSKVFNLDLDEPSSVKEIATSHASEEIKLELDQQFSDTDIVLPIKSSDISGNAIVILKTLQDITMDEFIDWLTSIYPTTREGINNILQLDKYLKSGGLSPMKIKTSLFNVIVRMSEERFMFGAGKINIDEKCRLN